MGLSKRRLSKRRLSKRRLSKRRLSKRRLRYRTKQLKGGSSSEEMQKLANEKTHEIITAYEAIKKHRGIR